MSLKSKLEYLLATKTAIKDAIASKDKTIEIDDNTPFRKYAEKIAEIETGVDTSDATATAADIVSGATAYVNGEKITGTLVASSVLVDQIESTSRASTIYHSLSDVTSLIGAFSYHELLTYGSEIEYDLGYIIDTTMRMVLANGNEIDTSVVMIMKDTKRIVLQGSYYSKFIIVYDPSATSICNG